MNALIDMLLALTVLVVLMHRGMKVGRAMFFSALALAVMLGGGPFVLKDSLVAEWHDKELTQTTGYLFVSLSALLLLVNVIGSTMQHIGISQRLAPALQGIFRSRRAALAIIPLLMGMLPTPGGIMLSAPMVRDSGDQIGVDRARQAAINFYFRHQWEPSWPLFPAFPLIKGMLGVSAFSLISHNIVISIAGITAGIVFLLLPSIPPAQGDDYQKRPVHHSFWHIFQAFWPILFTAGLFIKFEIPPAVGILVSIFGLLVFHRVPVSKWKELFRAAKEPDHVLLVFSALLFKLILQATGAVGQVADFMAEINVPSVVIVFVLPFMVSFMTGVTMPTVAITYPFLMAYIGTGQQADLGLQALAFSGILTGLLLTPVHLCLMLSCSYFSAPLVQIIIRMIGPAVVIFLTGIGCVLWL